MSRAWPPWRSARTAGSGGTSASRWTRTRSRRCSCAPQPTTGAHRAESSPTSRWAIHRSSPQHALAPRTSTASMGTGLPTPWASSADSWTRPRASMRTAAQHRWSGPAVGRSRASRRALPAAAIAQGLRSRRGGGAHGHGRDRLALQRLGWGMQRKRRVQRQHDHGQSSHGDFHAQYLCVNGGQNRRRGSRRASRRASPAGRTARRITTHGAVVALTATAETGWRFTAGMGHAAGAARAASA